MNWLLRLFGLGRKELPAPIHGTSVPQLPPASVPLQDVFMEAIQESYDEQYKLELELLNDAKLREYVKNMVKAMNKGLTKDSYDFILLHPSDAKINERIWSPFAKIMIQLCKSIDIPAKDESSYLNVSKKDVKAAFEKLKRDVIDIDERTRAMLSQGIYR